MAELLRPKLQEALEARSGYFKARLDTLSSKDVRRKLEEDLGLPVKSLDVKKAVLEELINTVLLGLPAAQPTGDEAAEPAPHAHATITTEPYKKSPAAKEQDAKQSSKAKKQSKSEDNKRTKDAADKQGKKAKTEKGKKRTHAVEDSDEDEAADSDRAESDSEEEERPSKKKQKGDSKKSITTKPAGPRKFSQQVEKLRSLCKAATITVGPNVYRAKDDAGVAEALEGLLAKHGLSSRAGEADIKRVRAKLKRERELDGIDTSNIITEEDEQAAGRRPRRAAAAAAVTRTVQALNKFQSFGRDLEVSDSDEEVQVSDDEGSHEGKEKESNGALKHGANGAAKKKRVAVDDSDMEEDAGDDQPAGDGLEDSSEEEEQPRKPKKTQNKPQARKGSSKRVSSESEEESSDSGSSEDDDDESDFEVDSDSE